MNLILDRLNITRAYWFIFFALQLLIVPLVPYRIKFLILSLSMFWILLSMKVIKKYIFNFIWPLLAILCIGAISGLENFIKDPYLYSRGFYYFLQPLLLIFIGFMAVGKSSGLGFKMILRLIIYSALALTILSYANFLIDLIFGLNFSLETRYEYGLNSDFAVLGIMLVYISRFTNYRIFKKTTEISLTIIFFVFILISLSRTNILIMLLILAYPYMARMISFNKQLFIVTAIIFSLVFLGSLFQIALPENYADNFSSKIMNSYAEVLVRDNVANDDMDYNDYASVNLYWRSQEAFLGLSLFLEGSFTQLFFGQGYGTYADGSIYFDDKFQQIPIFHNGFITIVLKSGFIGILLYIYFFFLFAKLSTTINRYNNWSEFLFIKLAIPCLIYMSLFKTFFIMGFYTPQAPVLLLVLFGVLIKKIGYSLNVDK